MSALFSKKQNKEEEKSMPSKEAEVAVPSSFVPVQESVITGFYISEKAGLLNGFNQYVFKVSDNANKSQLSRQVEKMFSVKVKSVKMMNTKKKRRDIGRHTGFKPGFKKAVVVLEKGHSIEQAR
ncbi:MAG: 50S ribosomal protein L23 [Candidatus Yanofskybacteria bacterium]|nr:50S ribosomal protein L23 [Candidatus Yanofskybacteria bacterium]